jgi:leucyl/phenylalanyl-tRNA---protein transferase
VELIDCQQATDHLASFGARAIPRDDYVAHVARVSGERDIVDWTYDSALWARLGI